ncbi:hypothetical protein PM082_012283 [Marasmius tenuissimus]|nr:hypothetical protein PM082_012283 [Marasmius tenuissimus]
MNERSRCGQNSSSKCKAEFLVPFFLRWWDLATLHCFVSSPSFAPNSCWSLDGGIDKGRLYPRNGLEGGNRWKKQRAPSPVCSLLLANFWNTLSSSEEVLTTPVVVSFKLWVMSKDVVFMASGARSDSFYLASMYYQNIIVFSYDLSQLPVGGIDEDNTMKLTLNGLMV